MMCTKVIWGQNSSLTERFASPEVPNREIKWRGYSPWRSRKWVGRDNIGFIFYLTSPW